MSKEELVKLTRKRGLIKSKVTIFSKCLIDFYEKYDISDTNVVDVDLIQLETRTLRCKQLIHEFDEVQTGIEVIVPDEDLDQQYNEHLVDTELQQPIEGSVDQKAKCESSAGVPKLPNFEIGNLHIKILNDANVSPVEDQERPSSPSTPFHNARTSTSENSPQNMQENTNLSNLVQNTEIPEVSNYMPKNKDIFHNPSDQEGRILSYVGNLESEDVLTFPHQLNVEHSSLLSPSEVQQTVGEGGSVIEFEVEKDGNLTSSKPVGGMSLEILEKLNETIIENSKRRYRRSSRLTTLRSATSEGSSSEREPTRNAKRVEIKSTQSETSENPERPESPRKRKRMSHGEAKTKEKNREKKDTKPCECGGTSTEHKAYYEMNDEPTLIKCRLKSSHRGKIRSPTFYQS
ncbi:hypothetical protein JTB14_004072 [Gonioctena quinquepunctata]|nr:hypothetical protein JTB14_004072 [Gonioctena quinquepunctata]